MHICHVITRLIVGGAQENTLLSCEGLHARGFRVTLVTGPTVGPEGSLVRRAEQGGYDLVTLPSLVRAVRPLTDLRCRREMAALFRRLRPDVVHTHSSKAGVLGRLAARDAGIARIVHTIHGMSFNRTQPPLLRKLYATLERHCARFTERIVTVADAMIEQSLAAGVGSRGQYRTIYSGMEIERFDPARYDRVAVRRELGFSDQDVIVATVARLFARKGYEQLIPIIARLADRVPHLRFLWIGDGAQRERYLAELTRLGVRERVTLTGLVPPEEIPRLLAGCDLLAHTSQWEGLPRAVVQGLLLGLPAVAFAIDGTPEVVHDHQTGRLIDLNDQAGFVEALADLAGDADRRARLGTAGRDLCRQRFAAETMVTALAEMYEEGAREPGSEGAREPGSDAPRREPPGS